MTIRLPTHDTRLSELGPPMHIIADNSPRALYPVLCFVHCFLMCEVHVIILPYSFVLAHCH